MGNEFYNSALRNIKPYNRASPDGNAPLFPYGDFPRRGKFALRSALGLISTSMHSIAKSSPSGEKVVPKVPKGVHFLRAIGAVVWFFLCYCPICKLSPPPSTKGGPLPQAAFITPSEPARSAGGTGGAQGRSPGGALNLGAESASLLFLSEIRHNGTGPAASGQPTADSGPTSPPAH